MASVRLDGSLSNLYWILVISKASRYLHEQSVDDLAHPPLKETTGWGRSHYLRLPQMLMK